MIEVHLFKTAELREVNSFLFVIGLMNCRTWFLLVNFTSPVLKPLLITQILIKMFKNYQ